MAQFWEFFTFELKFRAKSVSTYVYFLLWFTFEFFCIASESFGPIGNANGKVLLNGPYANTYNYIGASFFGVIVIAAIFGTSILRDFQRDTIQILFTKPISKFAYLGGRWAGLVRHHGLRLLRHASLADSSEPSPPGPTTRASHPITSSGISSPSSQSRVVQIFFLGSLFFLIAALSRKIFIVYLQGAAIFIALSTSASTPSSAPRDRSSTSGPPSSIPSAFVYNDAITRYWTVVEKNTLLYSWSGVFLYNRLLWISIGLLSLLAVWKLFPMSVETLTSKVQQASAPTCSASRKRPSKPRRSLVADPSARRPPGLRLRHLLRAVPLPHPHPRLEHRHTRFPSGASSS